MRTFKELKCPSLQPASKDEPGGARGREGRGSVSAPQVPEGLGWSSWCHKPGGGGEVGLELMAPRLAPRLG